jgi:hypothetical protein
LITHCFQDVDVVELVRQQFRSPGPSLLVTDRYGDRLWLVQEPAQSYTYFVSPFESGIELGPEPCPPVRLDDRLTDLVEHLLEVLRPHRDLVVKIRIPNWFFEHKAHALLEPFLLNGFRAEIGLWERLVDLGAGADEILAGCETTARNEIRRGLRSDAKLRVLFNEPVPTQLMADFYDAAKATRSASGGRLKHPRETYLVDRLRLVETGKAALALIEHEGFAGYLLALVSKELGFYFDGAWKGVRSKFASRFLHYKMMLFLKDIGCRRYSTGYVFPDLLSKSEKVANMARLKHSLGADLSPIYVLTLERESRVGALVSKIRRSPLGPVLGRLRRTGQRA